MKKQKLQGIGEPKETTGMSNKRSYTTVMRYAVAAKNVSDSFLEHGNTAAKSQNSIKMSPQMQMQMQMSSLMKFALYLNDSLKNSNCYCYSYRYVSQLIYTIITHYH